LRSVVVRDRLAVVSAAGGDEGALPLADGLVYVRAAPLRVRIAGAGLPLPPLLLALSAERGLVLVLDPRYVAPAEQQAAFLIPQDGRLCARGADGEVIPTGASCPSWALYGIVQGNPSFLLWG